jgi:D-serine deaminase-like pyridoxal phosphate-dependent protein
MKRRTLLLAAVAAPVAYMAAKKPKRKGGAHDEYFRALQAALVKANLYRPTLVIDRTRLNHNLERLKSHLPKNKKYRCVAKSLPSLPLIREIRAATGTDRLMVFHQPHLNLIAAEMPDAQMLLGKPMPVGAAKRFFERYRPLPGPPPQAGEGTSRIEWLIDTPQRLAEYRDLARSRFAEAKSPMRLNLELDVGLHRGGFRSAQEVAEAIRSIGQDPALAFSGFMGYEPHAAKTPGFLGGPQGAIGKAMAFYSQCVEAARQTIGSTFNPDSLTLNSGGSNTYTYYDESSPCNELAVGSALVKPTDFDTAGLADHQPASFIATPVLKALDRTEIPGLESLAGLFRAWDPNTARTFFIYGGYWYASPESPPGLQTNAIFGHSTNQQMLNGSVDVQLGVGDFVFLRPHQSEFVFLQFGDIAVYDQGEIVASWPVFPETEAA